MDVQEEVSRLGRDGLCGVEHVDFEFVVADLLEDEGFARVAGEAGERSC